MEWIPATDRLPDPEVDVLISVPQAKLPVLTGYIKRTGRWFYSSGVAVSFAVNAWATLPEPMQEVG